MWTFDQQVAEMGQHGFLQPGPFDHVTPKLLRLGVWSFQRATTYYTGRLDGVWGRGTQAAAERLPRLSDHFTVQECWDWRETRSGVSRDLLFALEWHRAASGHRPMKLVSCYRTPETNRKVGGAKGSYHLKGLAADVEPRQSLDTVRELRLYGGIGVSRSGMVSHVDVRHMEDMGVRTTSPVVWNY